jgi:hypothetical protein
MYASIHKHPRRTPSIVPSRSTAKVCPVIGTGLKGSKIAIWADKPTNNEPPTIKATS